ncbi:MAG: immunoglobulin domain-containing protein [Blastocatellia bacterium]
MNRAPSHLCRHLSFLNARTSRTPLIFLSVCLTIASLSVLVTHARHNFSVSKAATSTGAAMAVCGTKSVGPTGDYASLTAAIADITASGLCGPVILELQSTYLSSVETFPLTIGAIGTSAVNTVTIRPQAGATGLSIVSAASQTINLNGADFVTFDGRPGGTGTAKELTIENASGETVRFAGDATSNTISYCVVKGGGAVVILIDIGTVTGNDNLTIDNCDLRDSISTPASIIEANAGSPIHNNVTITNNNILNFFRATAATAGIIARAASDWTITGNRFYQEAARTYNSSNTHRAIQINSSTGNNFTISNNTIGFASSAGTGTYTMTGGVASRFIGIDLAVGATTASSVQGNTIAGIALTTNATATTTNGIWCGINITSGSVNVGTIAGNLIGSSVANGSITATGAQSGSNPLTVGINASGSGTLNISNNTIGGIDAPGSTGGIGPTLKAIQITASGNHTISSNLIGSTTLASSLRVGTAGTTTGITSLYGIELNAPGTHTISANTISGLTANGTGLVGETRGIMLRTGLATISNNTIRNLTTAGSNSVVGIRSDSSTPGTYTISGNLIHSLSTTSTTCSSSSCYVAGIIPGISNPSITALVERNFIHSLTTAFNQFAIFGIDSGVVSSTFRNNFIRLGLDASGNSVAVASFIAGMRDAPGINPAGNKYYFNSVFIGGNVTGTNLNDTTAFSRPTNFPVEVRNNIFANTRTNATSGGTHYAYVPNSSSGLTSDYNLYYRPAGSGGVLANIGGSSQAALAALQSATGQDAHSKEGDPLFINPTGSASTVNLHISTTQCSPAADAAAPISGLTNDFDNDTRHAATPDIGADEFSTGPPLIVTPPMNQTGCATQPVTFSVAATGAGVLSYQWRKNTVNIPGAVSSSYTIAAVTTADAGSYDVIVTATCGVTNSSVTSAAATLSVNTAPAVTTNPANQLVTSGTNATFSAAASGSPAPAVQWQESSDGVNFTNISGATGASYTFAATSAQNGYKYRAVFTNACGTATSSAAMLTVNPAAAIVISEFRATGPGAGSGGAEDWFVELYNSGASAVSLNGMYLTLTNTAGTGQISQVLDGLSIPAKGNLLIASSFDYSLTSLAAPDLTILTGFTPGGFGLHSGMPLDLTTQLDSVAFSTVSSSVFFGEGAKLTAQSNAAAAHSFVRRTVSGSYQDTNDNQADFILVSPYAACNSVSPGTDCPYTLAGATPGIVGPQNSASATNHNATISAGLMDPTKSAQSFPNKSRGTKPQFIIPGIAPQGQLLLYQKITNNTGQPVTQLSFRITNLAGSSSSGNFTVLGINTPGNQFTVSPEIVTSKTGIVYGTAYGLTLEQVGNQPNGGGINSTLTAGTITLATPLAPGQSVDVRFQLGVIQDGNYLFIATIEALPQ